MGRDNKVDAGSSHWVEHLLGHDGATVHGDPQNPAGIDFSREDAVCCVGFEEEKEEMKLRLNLCAETGARPDLFLVQPWHQRALFGCKNHRKILLLSIIPLSALCVDNLRSFSLATLSMDDPFIGIISTEWKIGLFHPVSAAQDGNI